MALKYVAILVFVGAASAGLLRESIDLENDSHPSYNFNYEVQDANTGDFKSQSESREGDIVQGQYSLHDADGYRRVVDYASDAVNGFRASVRREPLATVQLQKATAAVVRTYSAPTLLHAAPSVHLAPAAHFVHAAPAAAFVRAAPATVVHHAPAVVHSSIATPHFQYAF